MAGDSLYELRSAHYLNKLTISIVSRRLKFLRCDDLPKKLLSFSLPRLSVPYKFSGSKLGRTSFRARIWY
jgi:hypothetical protein